MVKALFDTNILIDYLNGVEEAKLELAFHEKTHISIITWMEVMVGSTTQTEATIRSFLNNFTCLEISKKTAEMSVAIRKKHKIKLPDAIVWATAQLNDCILVTRNTKDFSKDEIGVRVPYKI